MKLKWVLLAVLILIVGYFLVLPAVEPSIPVNSVIRDGQVAVGDAFLLVNMSDMAIGQYDNALSVNATDPAVLKKKADALIKSGRTGEAEQIYRQLLARDANDPVALVRTGDLLYRQGDYTGAITAYDKALVVVPNSSAVWLHKGDAYLVLSMQEEQKLHEIAKSLGKPDTDASVRPIESMESYKQAVESYQKAMQLNPGLALQVSTRMLGATQYQVNEYQRLLDDLKGGA